MTASLLPTSSAVKREITDKGTPTRSTQQLEEKVKKSRLLTSDPDERLAGDLEAVRTLELAQLPLYFGPGQLTLGIA
jgi:hypothetical protein